MDNEMYFTIERAGVLKKRFRARMFAANNELVWLTQTYADKRDAERAIELLQGQFAVFPRAVRDLT